MWSTFKIWIQRHYHKVINSIAFYPAFIGILFLLLAVLMNVFDFSEAGKHIKLNVKWLTLKDPSTARSIISAIASGIISLSVFSFSMVMIVLNQAASQMSNRVLDKLIGNRFQQVVLGTYIGTIVYALFLLSTIRDIDSGIYIPALSTYLLIAITITDIFLFIYFLHYITQSVKYEVIIERIYKDTKASMQKSCCLQKEPDEQKKLELTYTVYAHSSGIYEDFNAADLLQLCQNMDCVVRILPSPGSFVMQGSPLFKCSKELSEQESNTLLQLIQLNKSESIDQNFVYGIRQLTEIAIKALSPGINDPGTAIVSLRTLFRLLAYRMSYFPQHTIEDEQGVLRIQTTELNFEQIFSATVLPIWDYGKQDRMIQHELHHLLEQLHHHSSHTITQKLWAQTEKALRFEEQK